MPILFAVCSWLYTENLGWSTNECDMYYELQNDNVDKNLLIPNKLLIWKQRKSTYIWAASRKKGPLDNFDHNVYFSISCMCIILRFICEILSWIAVEIRFLWDSKHGTGIYGAASFIAIVTSWYLHMDMRKFTSVILYMNIICVAKWLFEANFEILHCSGAFARNHKHCKPECSFMQTHVDYFLPQKYDVISQLRDMCSYAKDPLWVTRLIISLWSWALMFIHRLQFSCFGPEDPLSNMQQQRVLIVSAVPMVMNSVTITGDIYAALWRYWDYRFHSCWSILSKLDLAPVNFHNRECLAMKPMQ